ncbi:hypothetical protein H4Q26_004642 [Puccinia striiformis f. sp. tritici PST-130]|nr:hypothetical protein H4Q26_004642 [Puccinia striiformis f. sp. tritici PST-130]
MLVECNLEAYSLSKDPESKIVIKHSLLRSTHVDHLSDQAKRAQLPKGFVDKKDEQVIKAVDRQIAETIKTEKGILRSCFLLITYYRTQAKYLPAHIGRQVQKQLEHGSELFLLTEIPPHCLVRLAYIRLETIVFVDSGSKARAAQWGPIDKQLLFMRSQTADYRLAIFGHKKDFNQIVPVVPILPTDSDIRELMARPLNDRYTNLPGIPIED